MREQMMEDLRERKRRLEEERNNNDLVEETRTQGWRKSVRGKKGEEKKDKQPDRGVLSVFMDGRCEATLLCHRWRTRLTHACILSSLQSPRGKSCRRPLGQGSTSSMCCTARIMVIALNCIAVTAPA